MNIAIIPARGGSKRVLDKNIRDFCGKPLITYTLQAAEESGLFDQIHVSTDDEKIARVAEKYGHKVDFMRAPELADDHTPLMPVLKWVLEQYQKQGRKFETMALLMPTAPLITGEDLKEGFKIFDQNGRTRPLLAVGAFPVPVEWAFLRDAKSGALTPCQPGMFAVRSQDLETKYFDSGTFVYFNAENVLKAKESSDQGFVSYVLPRQKVVDIDTLEDFELAEILYRGGQKK